MRNASLFSGSISRLFLMYLCFFSFCLPTSVYLFSDCACPNPDPTLCPAQPTGPPYQPCTLITSANSYVLRYSINGDHGSMTFIGNTLGLSKAECQNEPGTPGNVFGSIGAFTTIDPSQTVGSYATIPSGTGGPAGTTLDWTKNRSSATLNLPAGVIILHAELIWSGSFGYYCSNPDSGPGIGVDPACVLDFADGPITFITPDGVTHLVTADPTTALESQNPAPDVQNFYCGGNYTRSQDVTALLAFLTNSNGTYVVGGVPASISALDNVHNAAGWTLAIVYHDPSNPLINNMSLFLGAQQASRASIVVPASVSGFCAQTAPGLQSARLLVSAIEGDAENPGDSMQFGPTPLTLTNLSGPNNLATNFFGSQINDDNGDLISTTGTFCIYNQDPVTGTLVPNGRQGYDITNVDCSSTITSGQTAAFALGTTTGDDYTINAIGIQISVASPVIVPLKLVNGVLNTTAALGDTVNFMITMENTGNLDASNVVFQDTIESGLQFIPGSVSMNDVPMPSADPQVGIPLGTVAMGDTDIIRFRVKIITPPPSGNIFVNQGSATFAYSACTLPINTTNLSNVVGITLSSIVIPQPAGFYGYVEKCKFLNKNTYNLEATWTEPPLDGVVSYKIFKNGILQATIPGSSPHVYETQLLSKAEASQFSLSAVYANGFESVQINIRISQ